MKKLLLVNCVCGIRSTGRICQQIALDYESRGWNVKIGFGRISKVPRNCERWAVRIGSILEVRLHGVLTRLFDVHGTGIASWFATKRFINWAEAWDPDVLWLHNIHGYYLNFPMLFKWIKSRPSMEVRWTLHDCWAFTGHCSHFTKTGCDQWRKHCVACPEKSEYPSAMLWSKAKSNYLTKKTAFLGVPRMTIYTPSKWLAELVRCSFLREYKIEVVHNRVDASVYRHCPSDIKERLGVIGRKVILGVCSSWDERKGFGDFIQLRAMLDETYVLVMVGLTHNQVKGLPRGIVGLEHTDSQQELVELYSAADWLFNPTREDNYPTVNLEAIACGCRVATYDVGGCAETIEGDSNSLLLSGSSMNPESFARILLQED